jgi:uncharacterized damage-inducible protein DinB
VQEIQTLDRTFLRTEPRQEGSFVQVSPETLRELLYYHYDRREQVYDFLAKMKPEDFIRPMNSGWESIRETLIHCLDAERFWREHRIQGGERPSPFPAAECPDVAAVRALAAQVRGQTQAFVDTLTADDLARETTVTDSSGTTFRFSVAKAFLQIITHDTHHRGQVLLLARQLGYVQHDIDLL